MEDTTELKTDLVFRFSEFECSSKEFAHNVGQNQRDGNFSLKDIWKVE